MSAARRPSPARGRPAGRMPASVYWRRRLFVLVLAFALVFVIGRWLTGGSDAKSDESTGARQAGAQSSASGSATVGSDGATTGAATAQPGAGATTALAAPEGSCKAADVVMSPSVAPTAVAGSAVTIRLSLQTRTSPACVWQVNRNSIALRIDQGDEAVWSSKQCPRFVRTTGVVVRQAVPTIVNLTWDARESNIDCTNRRAWVSAGNYSIAAAPLGGEPVTADFALGKPAAATIRITETPKVPKPGKKPTTAP